jgi:P-type Ca2+ transporter type 2C
MSLLPVLFQWPLVLLPAHVLFLEVIIDPACSVVFEAEPEEQNVMRRPPRRLAEPMFTPALVGLSVLQGLGVLLVLVGIFAVALYRGQGESEARALTFTTLVVANLGLIPTNRSWSASALRTLQTPNPALWWVFGARWRRSASYSTCRSCATCSASRSCTPRTWRCAWPRASSASSGSRR